ncbi:MAG: hypothetical protein ACLTTL_04120 [Lachnospira pectinoschiza]
MTESDMKWTKERLKPVKAAINKAKICKKPIAGYDKKKKRAYVEYANGKESMQNRKPMILVLAGPNGSGKVQTTFDKAGK